MNSSASIVAVCVLSLVAFFSLPQTSLAAANANISVSARLADYTNLQSVTGTVLAPGNNCPGQGGNTMSYSTGSNGLYTFGTACEGTATYCISRDAITKAGYRLVDVTLSLGTPVSLGYNGACGIPENIIGTPTLSFAIIMEPAPATSTGGGSPSGGTTKPKAKTTTPATPAADTTAPTPVSDFKAIADTASVTLSWAAATDNVGVAKYVVERSTDNQIWTVMSQCEAVLTCTDSDLQSEGKYYYRILAVDAAGNQSSIATAEATTLAAVIKSSSANQAKAAAKNNNTALVASLAGGSIVILAIGGFFGWRFWRARSGQAIVAASNPQITPVVHPSLSPQPHKSLKEMVVEDYNKDQKR